MIVKKVKGGDMKKGEGGRGCGPDEDEKNGRTKGKRRRIKFQKRGLWNVRRHPDFRNEREGGLETLGK